jgi:hypothetical protein
MRHTTRVRLMMGLLALLGAATLLSPRSRAADTPVTMKAVKYDDLAKEIRNLKGKIVVVDVWGEY